MQLCVCEGSAAARSHSWAALGLGGWWRWWWWARQQTKRAELTWRGAGTAAELERAAGSGQAAGKCVSLQGAGQAATEEYKKRPCAATGDRRQVQAGRRGAGAAIGLVAGAGRQAAEGATTKKATRAGAGTGVVEGGRVFWTCSVGGGYQVHAMGEGSEKFLKCL